MSTRATARGLTPVWRRRSSNAARQKCLRRCTRTGFGRLELAGGADDLPDHVEAEHAGEAEARHAEPLDLVRAHEQRRREQKRPDDHRRADAVRDRAEIVLE